MYQLEYHLIVQCTLKFELMLYHTKSCNLVGGFSSSLLAILLVFILLFLQTLILLQQALPSQTLDPHFSSYCLLHLLGRLPLETIQAGSVSASPSPPHFASDAIHQHSSMAETACALHNCPGCLTFEGVGLALTFQISSS